MKAMAALLLCLVFGLVAPAMAAKTAEKPTVELTPTPLRKRLSKSFTCPNTANVEKWSSSAAIPAGLLKSSSPWLNVPVVPFAYATGGSLHLVGCTLQLNNHLGAHLFSVKIDNSQHPVCSIAGQTITCMVDN